jgi:hypothetical protein
MKTSDELVYQLFSTRNIYGNKSASEKIQLLRSININALGNKRVTQSLYSTLQFLIAYPDNKTIYKLSNQLFQNLQKYIKTNDKLRSGLYNSGITHTSICAAFSFGPVKWMRRTRPDEIWFDSFKADDAQIQSILSVVMAKTESEIFQDANEEWEGWLQHLRRKQEDLLDQLIAIFDSTDIRPEVRDELWNNLGIYVEIIFTSHCCLPKSLIRLYFHSSLIRKDEKRQMPTIKYTPARITENESEQIIACCRMIMMGFIREIDPISFTSAELVSYYHLPRGISIALMGMVPERRHPIDSYMGYMVFKNGLPVAYAGSWILFDSGRIGLNVFSDYRGGESKYIFEQVLELHRRVYRLKRFTVDPYQIGKNNSDGIQSGAFWIYYHSGFRPIKKAQRELAAAEYLKIQTISRYRSPIAVLKKLADSRQELVLQRSAVRFDATDVSRAYAAIITRKYTGNRKIAEKETEKKLADILRIKNYQEENMKFILKNWAPLLLSNEKELGHNEGLKKILKHLFTLKADGSEEDYIYGLQQAEKLRRFMEHLIKHYVID